jgi:hypothetical protein
MLPAFASERVTTTTRFFQDLVLWPLRVRALFGEKLKQLRAEIGGAQRCFLYCGVPAWRRHLSPTERLATHSGHVDLVINLTTARALGLTIPCSRQSGGLH